MEEFKKYLNDQKYSETSIESIVISVSRFKKWSYDEVLDDFEIGYSDVIKYIKTLQKKQLKPRSISMYLRSIKKYFEFLLLTKQYNKENPVNNITIHGVKKKKTLDVLTDKELLVIYKSYMGNGLLYERNKCMLGFILFQGFGSRELSNLKVDDVKLNANSVYIKGGLRSNPRKLTISKEQSKDLKHYLLSSRDKMMENRKIESDFFFFSMGSGSKLKNTIQNLMNELKRKHRNVRNIKQLRASVIANWTKSFNLREAQYMAGHRYVSSTESYLLNDMSDLSEEINKFHPFQ